MDALVAQAEGWVQDAAGDRLWHAAVGDSVRTLEALPFCRDWALAGPVIERNYITLIFSDDMWFAEVGGPGLTFANEAHCDIHPLVAAMRA
ncbi:hypothetical protein A9977_10560 [Variovorax sp. UMC13]|nr:hypothetical protein [Variovorax sp. UMC13]